MNKRWMMTPRNSGFITHLFVIIFNPWWWFILQKNFWIALLIFVLSFILFCYFYLIKPRFFLKILLGLTGILIFILIKEGFDTTIFSNSALEIQQYNKRHEFYAQGLGKIYTNRITLAYFKDFNLPLYKLQRNFFSNLDPNLYFYASHPRERLGIEEFEKYLPIFVPFFLLGFFDLCYKQLKKPLIYILAISLVSSFISPSYNLGPLLFFPVINFIITAGFVLSLKYLKKII